MPRGKEHKEHLIIVPKMDKKGRADVGVGIGSRVVEIDVQSTIFARIVPIAADNRRKASNDAPSFLMSLKGEKALPSYSLRS